MGMFRAAVLQAVIVYAWAVSVDSNLTTVSRTKTGTYVLQTSTSLTATHVTGPSSIDSTHTRIISQTDSPGTLRASHVESTTSESAESVTTWLLSTGYSTVKTTESQLLSSLTETEPLLATTIDATYIVATNTSMFSSSENVNGSHLFSRTDSFSTTLLSSTTIYNIDVTSHQETDWLFRTSELDSLSLLPESPFKELESYTTVSLIWSAETEDHSSEDANQIWSSRAQSTSVAHFQTAPVTKSETVIASSPTRTMMATSTPATPPYKPSPTTTSKDRVKTDLVEDISSGTKVAIAIIVAVCLLAVIAAGAVVYRRYNITHRSLRSFLTSGVRYKTYNNATYKDDEGMLIMPDSR